MLAGLAELARVVRDTGIEHHAVSRPDIDHVRSDRFDDAGAVRAHDVRQLFGSSGQALRHEQVEVIQRRGANGDAHFTRLGSGRIWNVGDVKVLNPAGGGENAGAHAPVTVDRKSTRLNSSHGYISYAVFCLK